MKTQPTCQRCGAPVSAQSPPGLCPGCMLQGGLAGEGSGSGLSSVTNGGSPPSSHSGRSHDPNLHEATAADDPRAEPPAPAEQPGTRVGPYKLLERVGEGGMGSVWMAEQLEPVRRRVALKLVKPGMDSANVLARFEAERQALALMDHPNIAKVLDGGTTAGGRPYFVMELVKGMPITKFCDEQKLAIPERLGLFIPVCQAIQHAHHKGILHRDLKPSNVLVALIDGQPVPKVIDFGLAKAMGQQLTERTLFTGFWAVLGTLEYMAPEQAQLNQLDIDTRSDLYSLGVLLYELLTGTTPLRRESLHESALDEVLRRIREEEAPRPSTRLSETKDSLGSISAQRKLDPTQLRKVMRGDLDWIVMKALEKDRNRRYETANGLAMDVQRHLRDEPVAAGPPTARYRLQKFVRKHRAMMAAAAGFVLLLAVATITSATLALWANQEKQRALKAGQAEAAQRQTAETERNRAVSAEAEAEKKLWESYLAQARANRFSGRPGRRFDSLIALSNAAAVRPSPELRDEAIAAMALTDVRPIRALSPPANLKWSDCVVNAAYDRYAFGEQTGEIRVCDSLTDRRITTLIGPGPFTRARFVRNAPLLTAIYGRGSTNFCKVWDIERGQLVLTLTNVAEQLAVAFDKNRRRLAVGHYDRSIGLYSLSSNEPPRVLHPGDRLHVLQLEFHPVENKLALCREDYRYVSVLNPDEPAKVQTWTHGGSVNCLGWSSDGSLLAVGVGDSRVYVWNTVTGNREALLEGHDQEVKDLYFNHAGTILASFGADGVTRFWDPWSGRPLLVAPNRGQGFSLDDRRFGFGDLRGQSLFEFSSAPEVQFFDTKRLVRLREQNRLSSLFGEGPWQASSSATSRDGRYRAAFDRSDRAVLLSDAATGQVLNRMTLHEFERAATLFSPDGRWLVVATQSGYQFLTVPDWKKAHHVAGDPGMTIPRLMTFSADSQTFAVMANRTSAKLVAAATGQELATLESSYAKNLDGLKFNSDRDELITAYETGAVEIWNLRLIRQNLRAMKLDWETPLVAPRPATAAAPASTNVALPAMRRASLLLKRPTGIYIPERNPAMPPALIHLDAFYNVGLTNRWAPSSDMTRLSSKTLASLPSEFQTVEGVRFDARGLIQLHSATFEQRGLFYPTNVDHILIGQTALFLHFLHATTWDDTNGVEVGHYQVHFEDGQSVRIPIEYGKDVLDWDATFDRSTRSARALAWQHTNYITTAQGPSYTIVRLFRTAWENPRPNVPIRSLDFVSTVSRAGPFLVGITASSEAPVAPSAPATPSVAEWKSQRRAAVAAAISPRAPDTPSALLDLTAHYNATLEEDFHAGALSSPNNAPVSNYSMAPAAVTGTIPGTGRTNNLAELPRGVQRFARVAFDIRGIIQLDGRQFNTQGIYRRYPERVSGIQVGRKCKKIHCFHGAAWQVPDGTRIGRYVLHYADGAVQEVPIIYGQDVRDWYTWGDELDKVTSAQKAWTGSNAVAARLGFSLQLYCMTVEALHTDVAIESLDFISERSNTAPFLIALTVD